MATYKVLQDIEAEDKLLGPLSLRQFLYAIIVVVSGFVAFQMGRISPFLAIPFVPVMLFFGLLAAPLGKDQPSEVWLLAKIRFMLKPRRRIWDQTGARQLVTITAPKVIPRAPIKQYSQTEIKSRLEALASTIDTRGWAVKNVNLNYSPEPTWTYNHSTSSDRLVDTSTFPQEVSNIDVSEADDIFEQTNPRAQQLDELVRTSTQNYRKQVAEQFQHPQNSPSGQPNTPKDYWFLHQPDASSVNDPSLGMFDSSQTVLPQPTGEQGSPHAGAKAAQPTDEEKALIEKIKAEKSSVNTNANLKTILPLSEQEDMKNKGTSEAKTETPKPEEAVTPKQDPAILELARNNDLNVATIARIRQNEQSRKDEPPDEVVVSLR